MDGMMHRINKFVKKILFFGRPEARSEQEDKEDWLGN